MSELFNEVAKCAVMCVGVHLGLSFFGLEPVLDNWASGARDALGMSPLA
jgi:hypothetical protein